MNKFLIISVTIIPLSVSAFAQQHSDLTHSPYFADTLQVLLAQRPSNNLDSLLTTFNEQIDSLKKNIIDPKTYLTALYQQYSKLSERLNDFDSLSPHLTKKLNQIDSLILQKRSRIDSVFQQIKAPDVNGDLKLNNLDEKISNLPSLPLYENKMQLRGFQSELNVPDLTINKYLPAKMKIAAQKLPSVNGNGIPNNIDGVSEGIIKRIAPVKELEKSQQKAESLLKQADDYSSTLKDPEALQEKAKEEFIDHLEGKEEVVKKDLEDIAKLQTKYRDIADSRLLPKHKWKMNAMKNKPFIERMIPGLDLQVFTGDNISVNAAPTISYKISGMFQSGISAFKRVTYFKKEASIRLVNCYGFRFFMQARFFKSFHAYSEFERAKPDPTPTGIFHSTIGQTMENRGFQNKVNIGIVHSYSMGKNLTGYFVVLYDVLQIRKFPNSTGSSARFGIQYELKKKKK